MLMLDRSLIIDLVDEHLITCQSAVESHLDAERMPYTQNTHYYQTAKEKWLARYKADRAEQGSLDTTKNPPPTAPTATPFKLFNNPPQPASAATPSKKGFSPSGGAFSAFTHSTSQSAFASTPATPTATLPFSFGNGSSSTTPTAGGIFAAQKEQPPAPAPTPSVKTSLSEEKEEKMKQAIALLAGAGYEGLRVEDLGKLHPPDVYEREMNVMAEVRGYFQVSYKVRNDPPSFSSRRLTGCHAEGHRHRSHDN